MEHGIPEKVRLETKLGIKISRLFPTLSFPNERQPFPNKEHLIKTIFEGSSHSDNKISREKITLWFCTCPVLSIFDLLLLPLPSVWYFHFHYERKIYIGSTDWQKVVASFSLNWTCLSHPKAKWRKEERNPIDVTCVLPRSQQLQNKTNHVVSLWRECQAMSPHHSD